MHAKFVGLLIVGLLAVVSCGSERTITLDAPASTAREDSGVTGTLDDWLGALCKLGTWKPTGDLGEPGVISSAGCDSAVDGTTYVGIWQFESEFTMRNTMSTLTKDFVYTFAPVRSDVWAFSVLTDTEDESALEPLEEFGFTVKQGPVE